MATRCALAHHWQEYLGRMPCYSMQGKFRRILFDAGKYFQAINQFNTIRQLRVGLRLQVRIL